MKRGLLSLGSFEQLVMLAAMRRGDI